MIIAFVIFLSTLMGGAPSNWTSPDAPCAKYDDLRSFSLGNVGVRIDAAEPWADAFRQALGFWNTVLAANFHEETSLDACAVRIINGGPHILKAGIAARAQLVDRAGFEGNIAVSPEAAKQMSSAEIYAAAVHELGHVLGLKHNANGRSVMYFLNIDDTEFLDSSDVSTLSQLHEVRQALVSRTSVPIRSTIDVAVAERGYGRASKSSPIAIP